MPTTKSAVIAGLVVALGTTSSAQKFTYTTSELAGRIEANVLGDACHPEGTYTLGTKGPTIPPCISEQMISKTCEDISGFFDAKDDDAKALAYKNCLTGPGSTYQADMGGCLSCKRFNAYLSPGQNTFWVEAQKKAWEAFKQDKLPTDSYWQYSLRFLPWDQYPNDPKGFKASNTSIEHYYPFAPESQSIGIVNRRQGKRALPSADEPRVVLIWEKGSVVGAYVDNKL